MFNSILLNNKSFAGLISILLLCLFFVSCKASPTENPEGNKQTIVERFGVIHTDGNKIVDKNGNTVALHGMSLFWSQWMPQYYNADCVKWLYEDWNCTVVRAAMAVEAGGYLTNPAAEMAKVKAVIDACIKVGIYVIVDWHDHNAELHREQAVSFFKEIATQYGDKPNLIYEIYNEPIHSSWKNDVKPYAEEVIQNIRAVDPDNLIIVGSPTWSQDVDIAAADPILYNNIAYSLHFYSATHKQELRNKAAAALNRGAALFVSEFGTCESSGTGIIDYQELDRWYSFIKTNNLSTCNWSIADKDETSAALKPGASGKGNWSDEQLTVSGKYVKAKIKELNKTHFNNAE
ncbi:MAG: glycoside hydrolase family 5 protein [Bacteroidetes bacterium]|nr:glycoside hydrolase family 5 protein [Bacteroidota bacterium]